MTATRDAVTTLITGTVWVLSSLATALKPTVTSDAADEGSSAEITECEHQTDFTRGSAISYVCDWTSGVFFRECRPCDAALCRDCDNSGVERQTRVVRNDQTWPGAYSFGIDGMLELADERS